MSGASLETQLDKPYAQQPETRAAAVSYLVRTGNADVIEALGLAVAAADRLVDAVLAPAPPAEPEPQGYRVVNGRMICTRCSRRVRADGICRQRHCGDAR